YERSGLAVVDEPFQVGQLLLSHHPMESVPADFYNLAGHIHPGVALSGGGRQRLRLPCFFFGQQQGLLPAFGAFTGIATVQPTTEDRVFVVTQDAVMEVFGQ
ncbi:MAG: phosphoesterase, partial [Bacteroidota bacterium]